MLFAAIPNPSESPTQLLFSFQISTKRVKKQKIKSTTKRGFNSNLLTKIFTQVHKAKGLPSDECAAVCVISILQNGYCGN